MKIGIIGTGAIGGLLTKKLTKLGHTVSVANSRGPQSLTDLAKETGATPVTVQDAVQNKDIVIITIPQKNIPDLPRHLFQNVPSATIVIDTGNYYRTFRDGPIKELDEGKVESVWVSEHIGRRVIKVMNSIFAVSLDEAATPAGTAGRVALPVAGDNAHDKAVVMRLIDELGFDPVDSGTLDESWHQEPGTPVYCCDYDSAGVRNALTKADKVRKVQIHENAQQMMLQMFKEENKQLSRQQMVEWARSLHK